MTDAENPPRRPKARKSERVAAEPPAPAPAASPLPGPSSASDAIGDDFNEAFVRALQADFKTHGQTAIAAMRGEKPVEYVKTVATLCTKDVSDTTDPLHQMSDTELAGHIEELAARAGYEIRRVASPGQDADG